MFDYEDYLAEAYAGESTGTVALLGKLNRAIIRPSMLGLAEYTGFDSLTSTLVSLAEDEDDVTTDDSTVDSDTVSEEEEACTTEQPAELVDQCVWDTTTCACVEGTYVTLEC